MARKRASLEYEVAPFPGAHKPEGVSEAAARNLEARGLLVPTETPALEPRASSEPPPEPARRQRAVAPLPSWGGPPADGGRTTPARPATAQGANAAAGRHQPDAKPKARGRGGGKSAGQDDRVQRTVRLTPLIDSKLRELAEERGIDLNAAVSVAVAEDWTRLIGARRPR